MDTMTESNTETYQGWANRETWAFNLHWSNDQGLYNETLQYARAWISTYPERSQSDTALGDAVVEFWRSSIDVYTSETGQPLPEGLLMFDREVGSWWRINYAEVGASVRESLDNES